VQPFVPQFGVSIEDDFGEVGESVPGSTSAALHADTHEIQLTRIFCVAHSTARDLAMCLTAALEKLYGV
jgi:hypothetical protein